MARTNLNNSTSLADERHADGASIPMTCSASRYDKPLWWLSKDGDKTLIQLYERHYSCYKYKDGRRRTQFVGAGETIVLRTLAGDALFVWRKFIDDSGEQGVNCAVFRNESPHLSSELIRQADRIADFAWVGERHYTYINPKAIKSVNPGACFIFAGWRRTGRQTKSGLIILEREGQ